MERGDAELTVPEGGNPAPITLLYVRPPGEHGALDERLADVAARYAPFVDLVLVSPEEFCERLPWRWPPPGDVPSVVVLRHGSVVGEAMGARLPARELDRVVRQAVEWPIA